MNAHTAETHHQAEEPENVKEKNGSLRKADASCHAQISGY